MIHSVGGGTGLSNRRVAVIMAGGSGQRFWPVSTTQRPKQFLRLTSPDASLLQEAVARAAGLFDTENTFVATGEALVERSLQECPQLKATNVLGEPSRRNTTGCLVWAAANLMAQSWDEWQRITVAVLTADHRISPTEGFHRTVTKAMETAEETGGLVTIGIRPDRPETGFGYIELGERHGRARVVKEFREKPDRATAEAYLASGDHLWNSGMFFWTLPAFVTEMAAAQPETTHTMHAIAASLWERDTASAVQAFEKLDSVSIDYALMERAERVFAVEAEFEWDDLGSWDALRRSYPADPGGNVALGPVRLVETSDSVVYNEPAKQEVCLLGLDGVVVVVTESEIMVCPADRAQDVRKFSD